MPPWLAAACQKWPVWRVLGLKRARSLGGSSHPAPTIYYQLQNSCAICTRHMPSNPTALRQINGGRRGPLQLYTHTLVPSKAYRCRCRPVPTASPLRSSRPWAWWLRCAQHPLPTPLQVVQSATSEARRSLWIVRIVHEGAVVSGITVRLARRARRTACAHNGGELIAQLLRRLRTRTVQEDLRA